jgi:cytochrome c peroxidase
LSAPRTQEPIQPIAPPPAATTIQKLRIELGQKLFFDQRLSRSGSIACNSCHNLARGGSDNLKSSIGHKWNIGPINSPTVLNAKYNLAQFWDGRAKDLREQAGGPIANPGEMASTHPIAIQALGSIPEYVTWFNAAYDDTGVTIDNVKDAIASFEETLVTPDSRFDQWLKGDDKALSAQELKGYELFKVKGCAGCHNGPAVGGGSFQKFGLVQPYEKDTTTLGRYGVTKVETDKFVFKVPTLRNVALTYPYFHDGSVWTLEEAVDTMAKHQLGLTLTKEENGALVAFLKTLTGKQPVITYPVLPPSTASTPHPEMD